MENATATPGKSTEISRKRGAYRMRPYSEQAVQAAMAGRPDYLSPAERWETARRLLSTGMDTAEIARRCACDPSQIRRIRCTFRAEVAVA